jgi:hypothetical protein
VRSRFRGVRQTDHQRPQSSSTPNLAAGFLNLTQSGEREAARLTSPWGCPSLKVDACVDTLATKDRGWRERQIDFLLRLRHRREQIAEPPANPN